MFKKQLIEVSNSLHIIIGEEGVVACYFVEGVMVKKLFIRSTDEQDTVDLRKIMIQDPNAEIHLYLDVMDQTYVQKNLPGISAFSINNLAFKRLEKETPKNHLKTCLQVGRDSGGRKDWIYTFISAAYEPPISTWVEFFSRYNNIIQGIYFLPVESWAVFSLIREMLADKQASKKSSIVSRIKKLWPKLEDKSNELEVLLTLNKSGGFRQIVFQNGKIIFSRLLNNISNPNPDVVAGNIEQELINSIEYLKRLSLKEIDSITIYMILSSDIKKHIRKNKLNAKEVLIFTPYEVGKLIGFKDNVVKESDRFSDPLLLGIMQKSSKRILRVFTDELKKIFWFIPGFKSLLVALKAASILLIILSGINVITIWNGINEAEFFEIQKTNLVDRLRIGSNEKKDFEKRFGESANIEQIKDITFLYDKYTKYQIKPLELIQKVGGVRSDIARVKEIEITYNVPDLKYVQKVDVKANSELAKAAANDVFSFKARFTITLKDFGTSYEELSNNYKDYASNLEKALAGYSINLSSLPDNFSFEDIKKPVVLQLVVNFPIVKKE